MPITYTPTTWANSPATTTPVSAANLQKIEDAISAIVTFVNDLESSASDAGVAALFADPDSDTYAAVSTWLVDQIEDTGSDAYGALVTLVKARVGLFIVQYNGSAWPTYSTDPDQVRIFLSQPYSGAGAPTHYNTRDLWFAYPTSA